MPAITHSETLAAGSMPSAAGKSAGSPSAAASDFAYEATGTAGPNVRVTGGPGLTGPRAPSVSGALEALFAEPQGIEPGTIIGEYEVTGMLGEGGMGQVFAAVHPIIGKKVAVKVLSEQVASNREVVRRFVAEARAVNQIGHPAIVDVFAFGQHDDGRHYYIMEHLAGRNLLDELRERGGPIPPEELVGLLADPLDALEAAHHAGIIHRDLKPDNIFICEGRRRTAKLLDFGIAKLTGDDTGMARTRTGMAMGTPQFMSPEQCRGTNVDHRTDIYALGVILYLGLTYAYPFNGATPIELFYEHTSEPPPPPSTVAPIPEAFERIILRCLEKDAEDRFGSAAELLAALQDAVKNPGEMLEPDPDAAANDSAIIKRAGPSIPSLDQGAKPAKEKAPAAAAAGATETVATSSSSKARTYRKIAIGIGIATVLWLSGGIVWTLIQGQDQAAVASDQADAAIVSTGALDAAVVAAAVDKQSPVDAAIKPALGTLAIRVNVSRADVFVDGDRVERERRRVFVIEKLTAGEHNIRVERRGYKRETRSVEVVAGERTRIEISLRRIRRDGNRHDNDTRKSDSEPDKTGDSDVIEDKNATIGLDELTD